MLRVNDSAEARVCAVRDGEKKRVRRHYFRERRDDVFIGRYGRQEQSACVTPRRGARDGAKFKPAERVKRCTHGFRVVHVRRVLLLFLYQEDAVRMTYAKH